MEVLVWYGDKYLQFMGIPVALKITREDDQNISKLDEKGKCRGSDKRNAFS